VLKPVSSKMASLAQLLSHACQGNAKQHGAACIALLLTFRMAKGSKFSMPPTLCFTNLHKEAGRNDRHVGRRCCKPPIQRRKSRS